MIIREGDLMLFQFQVVHFDTVLALLTMNFTITVPPPPPPPPPLSYSTVNTFRVASRPYYNRISCCRKAVTISPPCYVHRKTC